MPDTFTGYYNLTMPEPGGSRDSWGQKLNENTATLDQILHDLSERLSIAEESAPVGMLAYLAISEKSLGDLSDRPNGNALDSVVQPGWLAFRSGDYITTSSYWPGRFQRLRQALIDAGYPYGQTTDGHPKLPQSQGRVIRSFDMGAGNDPDGDRSPGDVQGDDFKQHSHSASTSSAGNHSHSGNTNTTGNHSHSGNTSTDGDHYHNMRWDYVGDGSGRDAVSNSDDPKRSSITRGSMERAGDHRHSFSTNTTGNHSHSFSTNTTGAHTHSVSVNNTGGKETRMKNICFVLCIRF